MDDFQRLEALRSAVASNAPRVAAQGGWPDRVSPDALLARLPSVVDGVAVEGKGGFDAGIACALDLIPRDRQGVAAALHAAYTPEMVERARRETSTWDSDSETVWWLAACFVCDEGPGDLPRLFEQLDRFELIRSDPHERLRAARLAHADMLSAFELRDGFPVALRDGGMQGAYLAGFDVAGMYAEGYDLWFLGTFRRTLGLEAFEWALPGNPDAPDLDDRLGRSGPVFGSAQFVKCCDEAEFRRAVAAADPQD